MKKFVMVLSDRIDRICQIGVVFCMMLAFLATVYQVFSRYLLQKRFMAVMFPFIDFPSLNFSWMEEFVRYLFIWAVFLGVALVYKRKDHAKIELVIGLLPHKLQKYIAIGIEVINEFFFIFLFIQGCKLINTTEGQLSPLLGVNMDFMYISILICCVSCFIHSLRSMVENLNNLKIKQDLSAATNCEG